MPRSQQRVWAPGRVNLIGEHVDYMGGQVFPIAIQYGISLTATPGGTAIQLISDQEPEPALVNLPCTDPQGVSPTWASHIAAVAAEVGTSEGMSGELASDLPLGVGLSSSGALQIATALALSDLDDPLQLAELCQRAEQNATGVPTGLMDQLCIAAAKTGNGTLIDCATNEVTQIAIPDDLWIWVIDSGQRRELRNSQYALRRSQAEEAAALVGHLPAASSAEIESITDSTTRRRARHVKSESRRVNDFVEAITAGDYGGAGDLMLQSHNSLAKDFEVSTETLDQLVESLVENPVVYGARLTGAGFGGSVVALAEAGAELPGTRVYASCGARRLT